MSHRDEIAKLDTELKFAMQAFKVGQKQVYNASLAIKKIVKAREEHVRALRDEFWGNVETDISDEAERIAQWTFLDPDAKNADAK